VDRGGRQPGVCHPRREAPHPAHAGGDRRSGRAVRPLRGPLSSCERPAGTAIGVHSPGHIAETDAEARDHLREHWLENRNRIGRERGWGPAGEREFIEEIEEGALYVGSPETVAQKIAHAVRTLSVDRFDLKYANGPMPHERLLHSIELYGTEVMPRVRALLAE
jgi:alkanesulfonate monooxygenase SsuD/methylene tetrahydromethanopterin reductase-like flavin-dependent oxidoreductase (luciferase family)